MNMAFRSGMIMVFALAVIVGILAGRSQSAPAATATLPPAATPAPAVVPGQVTIVTNESGNPPGRFNPTLLHARVGDTITFTNYDSNSHSVTADNGAFSDVLSPGQSATWKPLKPGKYLYSCFFHPDMRGEIDVSS